MLKSARMKWVGHVACMGGMRNAFRIMVAKPDGKSQLGRSRRRWEDNIKINLRETALEAVDWLHLS
jgi:hypothetical protein